MTPIADMVEAMLSRGVTPEMIVLAIRAVETVALRERDDRHASVTFASRSPAAIRAARYRENLKLINAEAEANDAATTTESERDASRDASVTTVTQHCDLTSLLPSLKRLSEKGSKGTENARARATRLVLGTPLSDLDRAAAIELGASADRLDAMWAEFVDYWISVPGQRGTKLNWSATWRNRVRAIVAKGHHVQATQHHPGGAYGASKDRFREAHAKLKAFAEQDDSESGGSVVELLSAAGRERA